MRSPTLHPAATWSHHSLTLSRRDGPLHRLALILLAIAAFLAAAARAEGVERRVAPGDMRSGSLLLRAIDVEERGTEARQVEAPRLGPSSFSRTLLSSTQSTPRWLQKRWSSEAMTARTRWGEIWSSGTQSRSTGLRASQRPSISVEGTGTNR